MKATKQLSKASSRWAIPLGLLVAFAIVAPGLTQESPEEQEDPGRAWAVSAGCDLSRKDVPMTVSEIDYLAGVGVPSAKDAILGMSNYLRRNGHDFSDEALEAAVAAAEETGPNTIEARLPGVAIHITRSGDEKYVVSQVVECA